MSIVARGTPLLERAIRQDRIIALAGVAALTLLAWIYLLRMAAAMHAGAMEADMHAAMGMPSMRQWG